MSDLPPARELLHAKLSQQRHAVESLRNAFTHESMQAQCTGQLTNIRDLDRLVSELTGPGALLEGLRR